MCTRVEHRNYIRTFWEALIGPRIFFLTSRKLSDHSSKVLRAANNKYGLKHLASLLCIILSTAISIASVAIALTVDSTHVLIPLLAAGAGLISALCAIVPFSIPTKKEKHLLSNHQSEEENWQY